MSEKRCINCFYLTFRENKEFPLDDYQTIYGCEFHKLDNGDLKNPYTEVCDDWISLKSGFRDVKLKDLGIK